MSFPLLPVHQVRVWSVPSAVCGRHVDISCVAQGRQQFSMSRLQNLPDCRSAVVAAGDFPVSGGGSWGEDVELKERVGREGNRCFRIRSHKS